jgi:hypothetical protein
MKRQDKVTLVTFALLVFLTYVVTLSRLHAKWEPLQKNNRRGTKLLQITLFVPVLGPFLAFFMLEKNPQAVASSLI